MAGGMAAGRYGSQSRKLRTQAFNHKHETEQTGSRKGYILSKPTTGDTLPPPRLHFLNLTTAPPVD